MGSSTTREWETSPSLSSLVSIGSHRLYATISGPPRTPLNPSLVIFFPGSSASYTSFLPVSTLVHTSRILLYDRSGLGLSDPLPNTTSISGAQAAQELDALLKVLYLPGPYVLVAHSYGGCVAREFLRLYTQNIVGMVLSETGTETKCTDHEEQYRRQILGHWPLSVIRGEAIFGGSKTGQERSDGASGNPTVTEEGPMTKQIDNGDKNNNSHEKARRAMLASMKAMDETLKREQLQLSTRSRFLNVPGCGHNVNQVRPDLVAAEVCWVVACANKLLAGETVEEGCTVRKEGKVQPDGDFRGLGRGPASVAIVAWLRRVLRLDST